MQYHRYSDFSNLYDDGYDDFVARKVKKMSKKAKGVFSHCSGCGSRQMFNGTCRGCGYTTIDRKPMPVKVKKRVKRKKTSKKTCKKSQ